MGTAGWSYKDWDGVFYPAGMLRRKLHPLLLVARCFDTVEINTSFYGHIKPELAKLWARIANDVNPNFVFTAKLHRSFTHSPLAAMEPTSAASIRPNDEDERLAREGLEALAATGKFGALLIQIPRLIQEHIVESRISGNSAATVHRVSTDDRSPPFHLEQSRNHRLLRRKKRQLLQH